MDGYFLSINKYDYVRGKRFDGCILCGIQEAVAGLVDLTICSTTYFCVSVNLYPYNPGHIMIYPKRHLTDIRLYTPEEVSELHTLQVLMMDVLRKSQSPLGFNIGYNMGADAGGSIDHLHLHIIPRYQRETGIADLLAGRRVMVEEPVKTAARLISLLSSSDEYAKRLTAMSGTTANLPD